MIVAACHLGLHPGTLRLHVALERTDDGGAPGVAWWACTMCGAVWA